MQFDNYLNCTFRPVCLYYFNTDLNITRYCIYGRLLHFNSSFWFVLMMIILAIWGYVYCQFFFGYELVNANILAIRVCRSVGLSLSSISLLPDSFQIAHTTWQKTVIRGERLDFGENRCSFPPIWHRKNKIMSWEGKDHVSHDRSLQMRITIMVNCITSVTVRRRVNKTNSTMMISRRIASTVLLKINLVQVSLLRVHHTAINQNNTIIMT